jgi:hypothetical protein
MVHYENTFPLTILTTTDPILTRGGVAEVSYEGSGVTKGGV